MVSMNMWRLTQEFLTVLEEGFKEFFEKEMEMNLLKRNNYTWYGMNYHEDLF